jgi:hypothetical protein
MSFCFLRRSRFVLFCFVLFLFLIRSLSFQVLNLLMIQPAKSDESEAHAQIAWYTASRSSILPCARLKPFLESYEVGGRWTHFAKVHLFLLLLSRNALRI